MDKHKHFIIQQQATIHTTTLLCIICVFLYFISKPFASFYVFNPQSDSIHETQSSSKSVEIVSFASRQKHTNKYIEEVTNV